MRKLTKVNNDKMDSMEKYHRCYKKPACEEKYLCLCESYLCNNMQRNFGGGIPQIYDHTVTVYVK